MSGTTATLTALRNELEGRGLIRRPNTPGAAPPLFIEPAGGAPAPGEREGDEGGARLVVTARLSGEGPTRAGEGYRRLIIVDLIYRSTATLGLIEGRALDEAIVAALVGGSSYGTGLLLDESGPEPVLALEASVFAGLGPVSETGGVRTESSKLALEVLTAAPA